VSGTNGLGLVDQRCGSGGVRGAQARVDGLVNGDVIPTAGGAHFGQDDIVIGCGPWGYPLNGSLDDLGIWTRALTSAEVARLYNDGAGLGESWLFAP